MVNGNKFENFTFSLLKFLRGSFPVLLYCSSHKNLNEHLQVVISAAPQVVFSVVLLSILEMEKIEVKDLK